MITDFKIMAVVGNIGSGKTSFCFSVLDKLKRKENKKIYIYKHPKPDLIKSLGFDVMYSISEMENIQDIVLYIDEPQLTFPIYEKKNNHVLRKIFSLARQRDIQLIISTSDTRYITKGVEAYIDSWVIKDLEYDLVKQGSMIKHIIKNNMIIDPRGFRAKVDEYLFYNRNSPSISGILRFDKPEFFGIRLSKPYKM